MSDWANEVVANFYEGNWCERSGDDDMVLFAAALRKAKADGMREAAQIIDDIPMLAHFVTAMSVIAARAREIHTRVVAAQIAGGVGGGGVELRNVARCRGGHGRARGADLIAVQRRVSVRYAGSLCIRHF